MQRVGKRLDDGRRRKRIRRRFQIRPAEQVADRAVEIPQFAFTLILDDAHNVSGQHRLVHRGGIDQREFLRVDAGEIGLDHFLAVHAIVDEGTQVALEIRDQAGTFVGEDTAGVETKRLLFAHIGTLRARHEQIAHAIEHRRKGHQQTMNGQIPAIAENPGHFLGYRTANYPFTRGRRHIHVVGPMRPCGADAETQPGIPRPLTLEMR